MEHRNPTFEEIDQQIRSLDLTAFREGGARHFTAADVRSSPGDVLKMICEIYKCIRPILVALQNFPLLPKEWRKAIEVFVDLMDSLCR